MLERADRLPNRRGMMREIVDHLDSAHFAPHFLPARDSPKTLERLANVRQRNAVEARRRYRHGRVPHVELADERHFKSLVA